MRFNAGVSGAISNKGIYFLIPSNFTNVPIVNYKSEL